MTTEINDKFISQYLAEREQTRQRRIGILSDVIRAGLIGFAVEPPEDAAETKSFVIANDQVRINAWFWKDDKGVERITFSGVWPRKKRDPVSGYSAYIDGPAPMRTVSAARPARLIANVVANKVYPKVHDITLAINARIRAEENQEALVLTAAAELVNVLAKFKPWSSSEVSGRRTYRFKRGTATVQPDGRYSLELAGLSLDQVKHALTALNSTEVSDHGQP